MCGPVRSRRVSWVRTVGKMVDSRERDLAVGLEGGADFLLELLEDVGVLEQQVYRP